MLTTEVDPHLFIVFGATGDLMRRKLLPALYHLMTEGALTGTAVILGVARGGDFNDEKFRQMSSEALVEAGLVDAQAAAEWCLKNLYYQAIDKGGPEDYQGVAARVDELEKRYGLPGNRAFYLALPPRAFPDTIVGLGEAGLNKSPGWTRIVVEKPFGRDLASAQALNALLHGYYDETQIYRIDHYLGKETVQNLLFFRFANIMFESLWNRDRVKSVEITVGETLGMEGRGDYYDKAGALRDMVQNHLTQLLTLTAMEPPTSFAADDIREEKVQVLRSIAPIDPHEVAYGQYTAGVVDGVDEPGYLQEEKVAPDSATETFVAIRLEIANWRWQGVPFYLRTGKRLPKRVSQIVVTFHRPPVSMLTPFDDAATTHVNPNRLVITIQPDEGFDLLFEVKPPGQAPVTKTQRLHFRYSEEFTNLAEAYQTLLLEFLTGDQTLFVRSDEAEASWKLYAPLLERTQPVHPYPVGTWGPPESDALRIDGSGAWFTE